MSKIKISLAVAAFVLAAGTTMAIQTNTKVVKTGVSSETNNCTSVPDSQNLDVNSASCSGSRIACCYQQGTDNVFATKN